MSSNNPMAQAKPLVKNDELVRGVKANNWEHKKISFPLVGNGNKVSKRLLEALATNTVVTDVKVVIDTTKKDIILSLVGLFTVNHTIKHLIISLPLSRLNDHQQGLLMVVEALGQLPSLSLESLALPLILTTPTAQLVATLLLQDHPPLTHLEFVAAHEGDLRIVMEAFHRNEHMSSLALGVLSSNNGAEIEIVLPEGNRIEKLSLYLDNISAISAFGRAVQHGHGRNLTSLDLTIDVFHSYLPGMMLTFSSMLPVFENLMSLARLQDFTFRINCTHLMSQVEREALQHVLQRMDVSNLNLHFTGGEDMSMSTCLPSITPVPPGVRKLLFSVDQNTGVWAREDAPNIIAAVFRNNTTLESVTLQGNKLTNQVVVTLASILPTMTNLTHVALNCKRVHHMGGTALLRAVNASPNLLQVDLEHWRKSQSLWRIVDEIFYTCKIRSIRNPELVASAPLSLYPRALSKLGKGKWFNVAFCVLRARCDVLIPSGKDSGDDSVVVAVEARR